MGKKGKWVVLGLGLTVFVAGFTFGVFLYYHQMTFEEASDLLRGGGTGGLPQGDLEEVLALEANLLVTMVYDDGCRETLPARLVPSDMVGKTRREVEEAYGQWAVKSFGPRELTVEKRGGPCPRHAQMYLGVSEGHVAIFQGHPQAGGRVLRRTNILLRNIPGDERSDLLQGIPVADEEEALLILEGIGESEGRT
ncbi:MAG: BofC C-terminal domain-containing protein [Limnochordia bacterium]|jgi:hypothetical protein